jgi:hypothetical protein
MVRPINGIIAIAVDLLLGLLLSPITHSLTVVKTAGRIEIMRSGPCAEPALSQAGLSSHRIPRPCRTKQSSVPLRIAMMSPINGISAIAVGLADRLPSAIILGHELSGLRIPAVLSVTRSRHRP